MNRVLVYTLALLAAAGWIAAAYHARTSARLSASDADRVLLAHNYTRAETPREVDIDDLPAGAQGLAKIVATGEALPLVAEKVEGTPSSSPGPEAGGLLQAQDRLGVSPTLSSDPCDPTRILVEPGVRIDLVRIPDVGAAYGRVQWWVDLTLPDGLVYRHERTLEPEVLEVRRDAAAPVRRFGWTLGAGPVYTASGEPDLAVGLFWGYRF